MNMNDNVQTEILTLEDLQQQKAKALKELRAKSRSWPIPPETYLLR